MSITIVDYRNVIYGGKQGFDKALQVYKGVLKNTFQTNKCTTVNQRRRKEKKNFINLERDFLQMTRSSNCKYQTIKKMTEFTG